VGLVVGGARRVSTDLWEGTVVPDVTLVWEAVADKAELTLLDVLLDWVEDLVLGDLGGSCQLSVFPSSTLVAGLQLELN